MRKFILIALAGLATSGCTTSRIFPSFQMIGLYNFDQKAPAEPSLSGPEDLKLKSDIVAAQKKALDCTRTSFSNARRYSTPQDAIQKACEECSDKWTDGDKALDRLLSKRLRKPASLKTKAKPAEICLTQRSNLDRDYLRSTIPHVATPPVAPHADVKQPGEQVHRDFDI